MIRQTIRSNTFETNSSSTHCMCIIPEKYWEAWDKNELYYLRWVYGDNKKLVEENNGSRLFTKQFLIDKGVIDPDKEIEEDDDDWYEDEELEDFVNSDGWDAIELEGDCEEYTTESGDKLRILCKYGFDG